VKRLSLLWKILLSTSVAITVLFAATAWLVLDHATRAMSESVSQEVGASFRAYQSIWKARAERLASISSILSTMSDVRAAFGTADDATIRDTATELWSRVSDEDAIFLVANPRGRVIASLGGGGKLSELAVVAQALRRFPAQATGFTVRDGRLYHMTLTPVYVQSTGGPALLNVFVAGYEVNSAAAARLKESTGGSEFVFIAGGRVMASTLPDGVARQIEGQLRGGARHRIEAGGSEYAPLVTPLADIAGAPAGKLAILRSFDEPLERIASLRRNVALLWALSIVVGLALTYVLARRIIEPVQELDRAAAEVSRQNYDCNVPVRSADELGRLAQTFNNMCASILRGRDELVRSERIATVGRLATSIVHDLRNPLAAIYGGAELLMESELPRAHVERLARNMYRASRDIRSMLDHLLEAGRGQREQASACKLREIAASAAESVCSAAEANGVEVALDIPEDVSVTVERDRIERVFQNLLANAIEAMPEGGRVSVSATAANAVVTVRVRDTGPGIAPQIRARLFQPFVTAGKKNGLGLGLALARQAVADHGGEMWVEAGEPGAVFVFRLRAG
jgi:signal transduction histidine kinase